MDKKHKQAGVMQSINKHCDASFCFFATRPDSNIDDFFMHENAKKSPFLSNKGKLRTFTKSQILACLPGRPAHRKKSALKQASVVIFIIIIIDIFTVT